MINHFRFTRFTSGRFAGTVPAADLQAAIKQFGLANYLHEPFWEEPQIATETKVSYTDEDGEQATYRVTWS